MSLTKPMLAVDFKKVPKRTDKYSGWFASGKIDGLRASVQLVNGVPTLLSRSLKPHVNEHLQKLFARPELVGLDGEIISNGSFHQMSGDLRRKSGQPDATFWVFDTMETGKPFRDRLRYLNGLHAIWSNNEETRPSGVKILPQYPLSGILTIAEVNRMFTEADFEGTCLRNPDGLYKEGRSATAKPTLIKVKDTKIILATINRAFPLFRNNNEPELNELGKMARSTHSENLEVDLSRVGRLQVTSPYFDSSFYVGSGFSDFERRQLMATQDDIIGRTIRVKYQPYGSSRSAPRSPVFAGFATKEDK